MGQNQEFKIRALPRSNEKPTAADTSGLQRSDSPGLHSSSAAGDTPPKLPPQGPKTERRGGDSGGGKESGKKNGPSPHWIIYVGVVSAAAFVFLGLSLPKGRKQPLTQKVYSMSLASLQKDSLNEKISRHMQVSQAHEDMLKAQSRLDNQELARSLREDSGDEGVDLSREISRASGVQMDQEEITDRVYHDLNHHDGEPVMDSLPGDRINARLANRKWMNEMERAERIQFIRNYIRSAYDRGYQVEIDQNLVVVGVKKIGGTKKVNIEQVIDRMAQQGL